MKDADELLLPWSRTADQQDSTVALAEIRHGRTEKWDEDRLAPGLSEGRGGSKLEQRLARIKTLDAMDEEVSNAPRHAATQTTSAYRASPLRTLTEIREKESLLQLLVVGNCSFALPHITAKMALELSLKIAILSRDCIN